MGQARRGLRVLVTGGAGYIGSHILRHLVAGGHEAVAFDNLSTGHRWAVLDAPLVVGDLGDRRQLESLLAGRAFDAVIHCAASIWVGESVRHPAKYYLNNASNSFRLFDLCAQYGIERIVLSSSAAVYGEPGAALIGEDCPLRPINPYGASKMMAERALADIAAACGIRYVTLRYFNVAGADPEARIGEATPDNSHLVKVACETALGLRPGMCINGTDYPTPDGTCVRDYLHVEDLARAHVDALTHLAGGGESITVNCGYARGYSVRQVLDAVRRVTGVELPVAEGPRRAGDPPVLVADNRLIRERLGWRPRHADLDEIVGSAWRWEQRLLELRRELVRAA
jgi:UDP-glucose 4-epimerase